MRISYGKGVNDTIPFIAVSSLASIAGPLSEIINCSVSTGIFPNALKIAKVVPVFIKGAKDEVTNLLKTNYSAAIFL